MQGGPCTITSIFFFLWLTPTPELQLKKRHIIRKQIIDYRIHLHLFLSCSTRRMTRKGVLYYYQYFLLSRAYFQPGTLTKENIYNMKTNNRLLYSFVYFHVLFCNGNDVQEGPCTITSISFFLGHTPTPELQPQKIHIIQNK